MYDMYTCYVMTTTYPLNCDPMGPNDTSYGHLAWLQGCYKLSLAERRLDRCLDDLESQLELEASALTMYVLVIMFSGCHMLRRKTS